MRTTVVKNNKRSFPAVTSKMDIFVTIVNSFQPSNIVTKIFMLYIAEVLNVLLI